MTFSKDIATFSKDYYEADVDRSTFTCDFIKARKLNTLAIAM